MTSLPISGTEATWAAVSITLGCIKVPHPTLSLIAEPAYFSAKAMYSDSSTSCLITISVEKPEMMIAKSKVLESIGTYLINNSVKVIQKSCSKEK